MTHSYRRLLYVCILTFITAFSATVASALECAPGEIKTFNWEHFGREAVKQADVGTQGRISRSTEEKAKYIANAVSNQLNCMRIPPNTSLAGRVDAKRRTGELETGTCEHVTNTLRAAFAGGGIEEKRTLRVYGKKPFGDSMNPAAGSAIDVNRTHMALVVVNDSGKPVAFDLWMHGGQKGTFGRFEQSTWNGLPASTWVTTMAKNGYRWQACYDCAHTTETTPEKMLQELNEQAAKFSGALRFRVVDADSKQAIDGASIMLSGMPKTATANKILYGKTRGGIGEIRDVKAGPYQVQILRDGYVGYKGGPFSFTPPYVMEIAMKKTAQPQSRKVSITAPGEIFVNSTVDFSAEISPSSNNSKRYAWTIDGVRQSNDEGKIRRGYSQKGTHSVLLEVSELFGAQWQKIGEARHTLIVKEKAVQQPQKPQPPANTVNQADVQKQYDSCVQSEKNSLAEAQKQLSMVGQKDAWTFFRCGPIGTNWQMIPSNACCDPFKRDSDKNMTSAAAALQRCGWNEEITKRKAALEKKSAECAGKYPQAVKR